MRNLSIWIPVAIYLLSLLLGTWLLSAALGISRKWDFRPVPPVIDSADLTQAVFNLFNQSPWLAIVLFLVFMILWVGFGVLFLGNIYSKTRYWTVLIFGSMLALYTFLLPFLIWSVTDATVMVVYFLVVLAFAVSGIFLYRNGVLALSDSWSEWKDRFQAHKDALDAIGQNVSISSEATLLRARSEENLSAQDDLAKGSLFSVLKYRGTLPQTQRNVIEFEEKSESFIEAEVTRCIAEIDGAGFSLEEKELLIAEFCPDHRSLFNR
jgi:hypothetical protein